MNFSWGITSIGLRSFCPNLVKKLYFFDKQNEQRVLAYIIDTFLKKELSITIQDNPTLFHLHPILASIYNQLHSDTPNVQNSVNPHLERFIKCFFIHLFTSKAAYSEIGSVYLLKIDNRIFLHILSDNMSFSSDIYSIITAKEFPVVFDTFEREDLGFKEYIFENSENIKSLWLPEFPSLLKSQIYDFYNHLINTFVNLESNFESDLVAATLSVLQYLIDMRNFFDVQKDVIHTTKLNK